jgi:hypothetical protein
MFLGPSSNTWMTLVFLLGCQMSQQVRAHGAEPKNRGALILTMAGSGVPSYLQASCLSIASSAAGFDMLIFHEDNDQISNMTCALNVKKINVHRHGLARLSTAAICPSSPSHITPIITPILPAAHASTASKTTSHGTSESSSSSSISGNTSGSTSITCSELGVAMATVLETLPYYLAEFKIGVRGGWKEGGSVHK